MKESFLGIDLCPKCSDWNQMFLVEKGLLSKRYYVGCAECQGITEVSAADAAALLQEASKGPDVYAYTEMWNTFEQALASHEGEVMEKVEKIMYQK